MSSNGSRPDFSTWLRHPGDRVLVTLPGTVVKLHTQDCKPAAYVTLDAQPGVPVPVLLDQITTHHATGGVS